MGLVEFHVDRIEVETVPKFVLFGGSNRDETATQSVSAPTESRRTLPVSLLQIVAVSLAATVLAFGVAWLKGVIDSKLELHC
ncbi:MAG: hypothetical protein ACOCTH_03340 [Halodesulfurarchaeum sp.]